MKKYAVGMFGGKFIPFHKGHQYCLSVASLECERVYCIMFINGADESRIPDRMESERFKLFLNTVRRYDNAIPCVIDVSECRYKDGKENWDMETPLVRDVIGKRLDAVYSSEPSYGAYFKRAYPEAEHILVDPERRNYPISGTMIREMKQRGDLKWKQYISKI